MKLTAQVLDLPEQRLLSEGQGLLKVCSHLPVHVHRHAGLGLGVVQALAHRALHGALKLHQLRGQGRQVE